METNCPECGAQLKALTGLGMIWYISDTNVKCLATLFTKEVKWLDEVQCEICKCFLGIHPTIVFIFSDPLAIQVVVGSRIEEVGSAEFLQTIQQKYGVTPEKLPSLDALRSIVAQRLKSRHAELNFLFIQEELGDYIFKHWRTLTPQIFVAGYVAFISQIPGVTIFTNRRTDGREPSIEDVRKFLSDAQAKVWLALCATWMAGGEQSFTFEEDMQRFIDPGVIIPGALERLFGFFDEVQAKNDIPAQESFCIEAIRASLCSVAKKSNSHCSQWAEYFFTHELAYRTGEEAVSSKVRAMDISEKRARATIGFSESWDVVARHLKNMTKSLDSIQLLDVVATKAGHIGLVEQVMFNETKSQLPKDFPIEAFIKAMRDVFTKAGSADVSPSMFYPIARFLVEQRRVDDLERFAEVMIKLMGKSYDAQARVEAWLGSFFKELRMPKRFLDRIGENPRTWEHSLKPWTQVFLWTERSNALRLMGRLEEALIVAQDVVRLVDNVSDDQLFSIDNRHTAQLNVAILLRETGAPDAALRILEPLVAETVETHEKTEILILHSLAVTYGELGRFNEAIPHLEKALKLAIGPNVGFAPLIRTALATLLVVEERYYEATQVLHEIPKYSQMDPPVVLGEASAWMNIFNNDQSLVTDNKLKYLVRNLTKLSKVAEAQGDMKIHLGSLFLLAGLNEILNLPQVTELWEELYSLYARYGQTPDPHTLISLARFAYEQGETEKGSSYLRGVADAFTSSFGGVTDLNAAIKGPRRSAFALNKLTRILLDYDTTWDDIRLVAELHRDAIGRAQILRRRNLGKIDATSLAEGLTDRVLSQLAPESGCLAVLEWVDDGERIASFLTCITASGSVSSQWLNQPDVNLSALAMRMRNRLANWLPSRPGDPFDLPDWQTLESWLIDTLSTHLSDTDHVVFIEHEDYIGIPWHVAAASRWTSSYAASWTTLLTLQSRPVPNGLAAVGVVLVPRFQEDPEVLRAMKDSVKQIKDFSAVHGLRFMMTKEQLCDHDAFRQIMVSVDIVKLLCHGYISLEDNEVALMLARNGSLPLAHSIAMGSELGRLHRLSWRECQHLPAAPRIVFSAACSTGVSHIVGLGERLGLFSALRYAGTSAIVAPRWDIIASSVLPILEDALERYIDKGSSLGCALYSACAAAEVDKPRWLAWSLALEGDWR